MAEVAVLPARFRMRATACLLDGLWLALFVVAAVGSDVLVGTAFLPSTLVGLLAMVAVLLVLVGSLVGASTWISGGTSVGKALVGLFVRRSSGEHISQDTRSLAVVFGRCTFGWVVVDVFLFGTILSVLHPLRMTPHDTAFGTQVVAHPPTQSTAAMRFESHTQDMEAGLDLVSERWRPFAKVIAWATRWVGKIALAGYWLLERTGWLHEGHGGSGAGSVPQAADQSSRLTAAGTAATGAVVTGVVIVGAISMHAPEADLSQEAVMALFQNLDAETGPLAADCREYVKPDGWNVTAGQFTAVPYNCSEEEDSDVPAEQGKRLFTGGPDTPISSAEQLIEMPESWRGRELRLSAYLGGYLWQEDAAMVTLTFLDQQAADLRTLGLGPVTADDRDEETKLMPISTEGVIPDETVSIRISVVMERAFGDYNDGYLDEIEISLLKD